jgi:hypothetical protein
VGLAAAAVVAGVLLAGIIQQYQASRIDAAAAAFGSAAQLYADGQPQAALEGFASVPPVGTYGALANLYRGHAASDLGDLPAAAEAFRSAANSHELPPYLRQEAHYGLGTSLALQGDSVGALEQYERAAELPGPFGTDARLAAAGHAAKLGDPAKARALYEAAASDTEGSGALQDDLGSIARWRLAESPPPDPLGP